MQRLFYLTATRFGRRAAGRRSSMIVCRTVPTQRGRLGNGAFGRRRVHRIKMRWQKRAQLRPALACRSVAPRSLLVRAKRAKRTNTLRSRGDIGPPAPLLMRGRHICVRTLCQPNLPHWFIGISPMVFWGFGSFRAQAGSSGSNNRALFFGGPLEPGRPLCVLDRWPSGLQGRRVGSMQSWCMAR
jgi:hypothetical protein